MTHEEMYQQIDRMSEDQLKNTWDALGSLEQEWNSTTMFDAEGGITMDEWAEAIQSRLHFVTQTSEKC